MSDKMKSLFIKYLWLLFLILGIGGFVFVWAFLPHQSEIDSVWQLVFKIFIFICITLAIAVFPNKFKNRYLFLIVPVLLFLGYLEPRITYFAYIAIPEHLSNAVMEMYTFDWVILFPLVLLSICLAYRLGGGTPGHCIKLALSGVIILFSGFNDFMWYTINPVNIPDVIIYAHHINMILGHYPTYGETIIFTLAHLPLLIGLLLLPLDKWMTKIKIIFLGQRRPAE
jgi:hypothetical protein